jgi:hypothetical protein
LTGEVKKQPSVTKAKKLYIIPLIISVMGIVFGPFISSWTSPLIEWIVSASSNSISNFFFISIANLYAYGLSNYLAIFSFIIIVGMAYSGFWIIKYIYKDTLDLSRKALLFLIGFFCIFSASYGFCASLCNFNSRFNKVVIVIESIAPVEEVNVFKARWATMRSKEDYNSIAHDIVMLEVQSLNAKNSLDNIKVYTASLLPKL